MDTERSTGEQGQAVEQLADGMIPGPATVAEAQALVALPAEQTEQAEQAILDAVVAKRVRARKPPAERREGDFYPTPLPLAMAITARIRALGMPLSSNPRPALVIEPSAGTGNLVAAARRAWSEAQIVAIEPGATNGGAMLHALNCARPSNVYEGRWEDLAYSRPWTAQPGRTLILGNPPFALAEDHVGLALQMMAPGDLLVFLLRSSFLCSQKRCASLWSRPGLRWLIPVAERPSFTGDGGTDGAEYALFCWAAGFQGRPEILPPLWVAEGLAL